MDRLKIFYDAKGKTLTVWFDDPEKEHVAEETADEVVLIKDAAGRVIGFERLNYVLRDADAAGLELVTV